MICKNCGEDMIGDGYRSRIHCPNYEGEDCAPDADAAYCGKPMTPLKQLTDETKSNAANAKALNLHPHQLKRWLDNDAHVNQAGEVFIKTKGLIIRPVSQTS